MHVVLSWIRAAFGLICAVMLVLACRTQPLAADAPSGQPVDGIRCDQMEGSVFHIHQHLAMFDRGKAVAIPSDVGRPIFGQCFYWIHTHTPDGIIHIESPVFRTFTLGQFFDIWGQPLSSTVAGPMRSKVALTIFVDGSRYSGNPRAIELAQHTEIVIESVPPLIKPGPVDWHGL